MPKINEFQWCEEKELWNSDVILVQETINDKVGYIVMDREILKAKVLVVFDEIYKTISKNSVFLVWSTDRFNPLDEYLIELQETFEKWKYYEERYEDFIIILSQINELLSIMNIKKYEVRKWDSLKLSKKDVLNKLKLLIDKVDQKIYKTTNPVEYEALSWTLFLLKELIVDDHYNHHRFLELTELIENISKSINNLNVI